MVIQTSVCGGGGGVVCKVPYSNNRSSNSGGGGHKNRVRKPNRCCGTNRDLDIHPIRSKVVVGPSLK